MSERLVVDFLYFEDCPSWREALSHLQVLRTEIAGLDVEMTVVDTPELAEALSFRGSPSLQVAGCDLFADDDAPVGLSCRIYQTAAGPAGSPTIDQLRSALTG